MKLVTRTSIFDSFREGLGKSVPKLEEPYYRAHRGNKQLDGSCFILVVKAAVIKMRLKKGSRGIWLTNEE